MEVVDDFEARPHKAVTLEVERDQEIQVRRGQKMPKASPGFGGGKLLGRSHVEEGIEREEEEEGQNMENELMNETLAGWPRETDAADCGVTRRAVFVAQGTDAGGDLPVNLGSGLRGRIGWKEPRRA